MFRGNRIRSLINMRTTRWIEARDVFPLISVAIVCGAAFYSILAPEPQAPELRAHVGKEILVEGVVIRDPDKRERTTHLTVRAEMVNDSVLASGRVLIFDERFSNVVYGDRVRVSGILSMPEEFETDTGRLFDYPKYLLAHGVTHTMSFPKIRVLAHGEGNYLLNKLYEVKHAFIRAVGRALPEPESALLNGLLLLGEKQSLGEDVTHAMRNAGVVHIIVLSGYNVAIVIQAITFVLLYLLPRVYAFGVAAVFVIAFALMTGLSETTLRATLMALLMMIATVLHRPKVALRGLLFAAALMSLFNPYVVLYDLSFQLSVLATLGLILFSDRIATYLPFITTQFKLREIVSTTLATQVTVLPLLIYSIGAVSLVFLPANVLVLPAVPVAMFLGFIAGTLELMNHALAFSFAWTAYAVLYYIIEASVWFGSWSFSAITIPPTWLVPTLCALGLSYLTAFLIIVRRSAPPLRSHSDF